MARRIRRVKKITSTWRRTYRRLTDSATGRKVLVPVKVRKVRGKYQIRRIRLKKRGPKFKKRKSPKKTTTWD